MEFTGDEKKIQALFSELALEQHTPSFKKLWRAAETNTPAPLVRRSALALVTAAVLVAVGSITMWSWYRSSQSQNAANIPPQIIPATPESRVEKQLLSADSRDSRTVRPRRARPRQPERLALRQAAVLSNWQSPTNILLNSPTASFLSSLPQLNQSARDLEQFLPKNNDVMKESKQ
jgi:hypothetical protein